MNCGMCMGVKLQERAMKIVKRVFKKILRKTVMIDDM